MADSLGIVLASGSHSAAHAAFLMAAGAAALGRSVVVFATGPGTTALLADIPAWAPHETRLAGRGVATLAELRAAASELGVRMIACESGLQGEAVEPSGLLAEVETSGMASFLEAIRHGQLCAF